MKCEVFLRTSQRLSSIGQVDYEQVSCLQVHDAGITTTGGSPRNQACHTESLVNYTVRFTQALVPHDRSPSPRYFRK